MKILVNINHPAHVHLFRNAIRIWQEKGFQTLVVARKKDVTLALLEHYQIPFILGSNSGPGLTHQLVEFMQQTGRMVAIGRRFKPDVLLSMGSPMAAWAAALLRRPHIAFDDTEHARLEHLLYRPFTKRIYTPACFEDDLGVKQVRYEGYQELAYLHPNYFQPNPDLLAAWGLSPRERYVLLRLVSWDASHDVGQHGFTTDQRRDLVHGLSQIARVIISAEGSLPSEFEPYRMTVPPHQIHHLMAYASLYVGEGATMASEAAILGTPSIYVNSLALGYLEEQEVRYGLVTNLRSGEAVLDRAMTILENEQSQTMWRTLRKQLLAEKIDVTRFITEQIERYVQPVETRSGNTCEPVNHTDSSSVDS